MDNMHRHDSPYVTVSPLHSTLLLVSSQQHYQKEMSCSHIQALLQIVEHLLIILKFVIIQPMLELILLAKLKVKTKHSPSVFTRWEFTLLPEFYILYFIKICYMATRPKPGVKPPAKKKIERPGLTQDEIEELREAFNLFDTQATGKIDPRELKSAMQSLGFQSKNPTIFNMIADLQSQGREVDFEEFLDGITSKLGDKESRNGINKIFDLFDDDHTGSINSNNIRRVAKELGETMNIQELEEMLQRAATNGREISREDFYNIMTKKAF